MHHSIILAHMNIQQKFGNRLRDLRLKANISQEDLAFKADLDRTYISSIERGLRNVSITVIEQLAIALDVPMTDLVNFK